MKSVTLQSSLDQRYQRKRKPNRQQNVTSTQLIPINNPSKWSSAVPLEGMGIVCNQKRLWHSKNLPPLHCTLIWSIFQSLHKNNLGMETCPTCRTASCAWWWTIWLKTAQIMSWHCCMKDANVHNNMTNKIKVHYLQQQRTSCFDHQIPNFAMMVCQKFGLSINMCEILTKIL